LFLMYIDGSGDAGLVSSPTKYFVLSGLILHELRWQLYLNQIVEFRKRMRVAFGLRMAEEIHASAFINNPGALIRITRNDRLSILRFLANELIQMTDLNVISIVVDKSTKAAPYDVFDIAWKALFQRFENTLTHHNFTGPSNPDEKGIVLPDNTDNAKVQKLIRQMRRYNPIPNQPSYQGGYRNMQISSIVEDPNFRDSRHSYFIQAVDLIAFFLYQYISPSSYIKRKGLTKYFEKFGPILCKQASRTDPLGIVRI
jgi:hypothetical protein